MIKRKKERKKERKKLWKVKYINDKNCSLSIALTAMDQKLQKS